MLLLLRLCSDALVAFRQVTSGRRGLASNPQEGRFVAKRLPGIHPRPEGSVWCQRGSLSWDCIEGWWEVWAAGTWHISPSPLIKSGTEPLSWALASGQQAKQTSHKLGAVRRELTHGELGPGWAGTQPHVPRQHSGCQRRLCMIASHSSEAHWLIFHRCGKFNQIDRFSWDTQML